MDRSIIMCACFSVVITTGARLVLIPITLSYIVCNIFKIKYNILIYVLYVIYIHVYYIMHRMCMHAFM